VKKKKGINLKEIEIRPGAHLYVPKRGAKKSKKIEYVSKRGYRRTTSSLTG